MKLEFIKKAYDDRNNVLSEMKKEINVMRIQNISNINQINAKTGDIVEYEMKIFVYPDEFLEENNEIFVIIGNKEFRIKKKYPVLLNTEIHHYEVLV